MIGIVDYGTGNISSVANALEHLGVDCRVVNKPDEIDEMERLILPGVGAYARAMGNMDKNGMTEAIKRHIEAGKPFLGICLGMQMLSSVGFEEGPVAGLGILEGEVDRIPVPPKVCLPHVGWNTIQRRAKHPMFEGIREDVDFYFVHSYCFKHCDPRYALSVTEYAGTAFVSSVAKGSALGVQFHPEKSQENGLKILENFCRWDGKC